MKKYLNKIFKGNWHDLNKLLEQSLLENQKQFIITANPETMMIADKSKQMEEIILNPEYIVVADGVGVVKACQTLNIDKVTKLPGIEIAVKLLELANNYQKSVLFFGASEDVNQKLVKKVNEKYPNLKIAGNCHGYVDDKESKYKQLLQTKPDIIMVALGIPSQELLIDQFYKNSDKGIFIGVGGSFDVISESKKRAPKLFRKLNIEWLYRIIIEPKRIKRFYQNNVKFIKIIKKEQ